MAKTCQEGIEAALKVATFVSVLAVGKDELISAREFYLADRAALGERCVGTQATFRVARNP